MKRLPDWMLRFERLVQERRSTRFAFGHHDCSIWSCDAVLAATGRDPGEGIRGTYATEAEAAAVLKANGSLLQLAQARFGAEISPALAAPCDVGLVDTPRGPALVVCNGAGWLAAAPFGLAYVPTSDVKRAWRCEVA